MKNRERQHVNCSDECRHEYPTLAWREHVASVQSAIKKSSEGTFRRVATRKHPRGKVVSNRHSYKTLIYKTMLRVLRVLERNYGPYEPERCTGVSRDFWHHRTVSGCCRCADCIEGE